MVQLSQLLLPVHILARVQLLDTLEGIESGKYNKIMWLGRILCIFSLNY